MKKILITIATLITGMASAQQLTFESQHMLNHYLLNPGAAGAMDNLPIGLSFRQQWAGLDGAPRTQLLSGHYKFQGKKVGVGGIMFNDITGPLRKTGMEMTYAYHLDLNETDKISFGLSALLSHYTLDKTQFILHHDQDQVISGAKDSQFVPDANFGVYYYSDKYFAGISFPQLFQNKLKLGEINIDENQLRRHYYISGGYTFEVSEYVKIEPSLLMKKVVAAPLQVDINTRVIYDDFIWGGLSYRNSESIVTLLGMKKGPFFWGYAYDWTVSDLRHYSGGTHELYLQYTLSVGAQAAASID